MSFKSISFRHSLLIIHLSFSLVPFSSQPLLTLSFGSVILVVAFWLQSKIWPAGFNFESLEQELKPKDKLFIFGREAENSGLYESHESKKRRSEKVVGEKKVLLGSFLYSGIVLLIFFLIRNSLNIIPGLWMLILIFYNHFIISSSQERDQHRSWILSVIATVVLLASGSRAEIVSMIIWLISLIAFLAYPHEASARPLLGAHLKDYLLRVLRTFTFVFFSLMALFQLCNVRPFEHKATSLIIKRTPQEQGSLSNQSDLGSSTTNGASLPQNSTSTTTPDRMRMEAISNPNIMKNPDDPNVTKFKQGQSSNPFPSGLSNTKVPIALTSPTSVTAPTKEDQKKRFSWKENKKYLIGALTIFGITILIAYGWWRKDRKSPLKRRLTQAERQSLQEFFNDLYKQSFSPSEEVLQFYYGIEKTLMFVDLDRPSSIPPLYHQANLEKIFPRLGQELQLIVQTYYQVLHFRQEPEKNHLLKYRNSIRKTLRLIGVY